MTTIRASVRTVRRFLPSMQLLVCLAATGVRADFSETDFAGWRAGDQSQHRHGCPSLRGGQE